MRFSYSYLILWAQVSPRRDLVNIASIATTASAGNSAGQLNVDLLTSVLNLEKTTASQLFASLGIGQYVNTYA